MPSTRQNISDRIVIANIALGIVIFVLFVSFLFSVSFENVIARKIIATTLEVSDKLTIPVDGSSDPSLGSIQYSTVEESVQVYDGEDWVNIGGGGGGGNNGDVVLEGTETGLISGLNDPIPDFTVFQSSFSGGINLVSDETSFNSATASANENGIIRLSGNISFASTVTIPNKALWIDLNTFSISVPVQTTFSIVCQHVNKTIYFSNGTIQYNPTGTAGSSSAILRAINCNLVINNTTVIHGEYAASIAGTGGNRMTFYATNSTFSITKARSSNNNTYGSFLFGGSVTADSYTYLKGCTFGTVPGETYLNSATDRYTLRGVMRVVGAIPEGALAMTGCTIDPAHRIQAVFYADVLSYTPTTRGNYKILMDSNTIGDAGEREQLVLLIGTNPLNGFESIWMVENIFERMDSNKGIMYIDSSSGGSADVYWIDNTIPTMKTVSPIVFADSVYDRIGTTVTVTTGTAHGFTPGYVIVIGTSVGGLSNGTYIVQTVPSPTQFTIIDTVSGDVSGTTTVFDSYATSLRKIVSKDGFVRGPSTISRVYLKKYIF